SDASLTGYDGSTALSSTGNVSKTASVDTDPSSAVTSTTAGPFSLPSQVAALLSSTSGGAGGYLTTQPSNADTGQIAAAVSASSTMCTGADAAGSPLTTGATTLQPCVSGKLQPSGSTGAINWWAPSPQGFGGT